MQKQQPEMFYIRAVLYKTSQYSKMEDKTPVVGVSFHLIHLIHLARILKTICEQLLLKMCSWNWEKYKNIHKEL